MSKTHTTKHDHGDGTHTEVKTTTYPSGASKTVVSDITERGWFGGDKVVEVTRTDSNGNSTTRRVRD